MPLQKQWNIAGIAKAVLLSFQGWLCLPLNESFCSTGAEVWKATNHWKQYINKKTTVLGTKITRNHTVLRTKCPRIMHFLWSLVHPDDHNSGWKWLIDTKVSLFLYFPVLLYTDSLWATQCLMMSTRTNFKKIFICESSETGQRTRSNYSKDGSEHTS